MLNSACTLFTLFSSLDQAATPWLFSANSNVPFRFSHPSAAITSKSQVGGYIMATPWLTAAAVDDGEKKKEQEELLVFGYACKLFPYDEKAALIEAEKHLIPWMGDENVMIDRSVLTPGWLLKRFRFKFSNFWNSNPFYWYIFFLFKVILIFMYCLM